MQLVIKARPHKYIKKYRGKTGRWEYVYAEGKGPVKKKPQPSPPQRYKQEHLDVLKKYFTPKQVDMIKRRNLVPLTLHDQYEISKKLHLKKDRISLYHAWYDDWRKVSTSETFSNRLKKLYNAANAKLINRDTLEKFKSKIGIAEERRKEQKIKLEKRLSNISMPSVKIVKEQALKDYTSVLNMMPQDFRIEYRNRIKSEFGITTFNQLIKRFKGPEAGANWTKYQDLMRRLGEEMKQGWHHAHNIQLPFERVFLASQARDDLDWKLHSAYPEKDGIKVTMEQKEESEQGYPTTIATAEYVIGWEFAKDFMRKFAGSEQQKNRLLKRISVSPGYMRWQAQGGNPEITKAIKQFKDLTGLDFQTEFYGKGQAGLKPEYINKIHNIFETIQKHVNIKNYKPPDKQQLKVKVEGAGKWAKGLYFEQSKTIGISPSWPGTITHELAHYFWYRDPNLQREFMNWAHESGYYDRVSKYALGRIDEKEMEGHIDSTFSYSQRTLDGLLSKAGKKAAMRGNVRMCKRGAQYLMNGTRELMKAQKGAFVSGTKTLDRFMELDNKQLMTFSTKLKKIYGDAAVPGSTPVSVVNDSLRTLRDVLKRDPSIKSDVEWCMKASTSQATKSELRRREYSQYTSKGSYWQEPTEMFARAFETYLRFREGIKEGSRDNPYGFAHGKVDPDWSVFKKNKKFERMLKRYIGSKVIKSIAIMIRRKPSLIMHLSKGKAFAVGAITTHKDGSKHKKLAPGKWVQVSQPKKEKTVKSSIDGHEYEIVPKSQWGKYFAFLRGEGTGNNFKVNIPRKHIAKVIKKFGYTFVVHRTITADSKNNPYIKAKQWQVTETTSGLGTVGWELLH